jgi:transposase-like protein
MKQINQAVRQKGQRGRISVYPISFQRKVAKEYVDGSKAKVEVAKFYGLTVNQIDKWIKKYSSELREEIIVDPMTEQEKKDMQALQKQLDALKKKLEYEQMRNFALETMVDLAKEQMGIDLRKNFGAKQPKE